MRLHQGAARFCQPNWWAPGLSGRSQDPLRKTVVCISSRASLTRAPTSSMFATLPNQGKARWMIIDEAYNAPIKR